MAYPAHRDGDLRDCGAVTVVQNQSTVFVNGKLRAVEGSFNNHGNGGLIPTTGQSVFIEGKPVIVHGPDHAEPDDLCPMTPQHCDPKTAEGSGDVFSY
jgi:uncharacterized Zn-binding protein involved in type VI secretion